jgi:hypothetical protein
MLAMSVAPCEALFYRRKRAAPIAAASMMAKIQTAIAIRRSDEEVGCGMRWLRLG